MKGFPNQIADFGKLSRGLDCIVRLIDSGQNPKDDGVLGVALVRAGVLGTGHTPRPVGQYLRVQLRKPLAGQSFRTSARGLRELYRLLGLIDDAGAEVVVTPNGRQAAGFSGKQLGAEQIEFWRRLVRDFSHDGGDGTESHPYQVLLRLVARRPGTTRALCALALEARDDSPGELRRIMRLAQLPEKEILRRIGVSKANWDNAKKVIPRFAEQLADVIKSGQTYRIADAPGRGGEEAVSRAARPTTRGEAPAGRARGSRAVTAGTIGTAGIGDRDEPPLPPDLDPAAVAAAIQLRLDRLRRHNQLVRQLATRLAEASMALFEDPFDVLAVHERIGILVEVKTLDGSQEDERQRVRAALAQLLYYEAFVTIPVATTATIHKVACFEGPISTAHRAWLNHSGIGTIWIRDGGFVGDELASRMLGGYLEELR